MKSLMRRRGQRRDKRHKLYPRHGELVCAAGEIASVLIETADDPADIDHLWIDIRAGEDGPVRLSLSTSSRISRLAGLDARVRLGIVPSTWSELPRAGVQEARALDYATIEAAHEVNYVPYERLELERLLVERTRRAVFVAGWGELYVHAHAGVHQIHSRRGSFALPADVIGHDGALQLFFARDNHTEMLLFKFAGQP